MSKTINRSGAEILASVALPDINGYAKRHPEAYAKYIALKERKQNTAIPKRRKARKGAAK